MSMHLSPLAADLTQADQILGAGPRLMVGRHACTPDDPGFGERDRVTAFYLVFPLSATSVSVNGGHWLVKDRNQVVLLAPGDGYRRRPVSREGDVSGYLCLDHGLLADALGAEAPELLDALGEAMRFPTFAAAASPALVARQRALEARLAGDAASLLEIEERGLALAVQAIRECARAWSLRRRRYLAPRLGRGRRPTLHWEAVERAKAWLARHYDENVSLDALGAVACTAPTHLARIFRIQTGVSVHAWQTRLRLLHAVERLLDSPRPAIGDVAVDVGFAHHSHFSAHFQRSFGMSPSAFLAAPDRAVVAQAHRASAMPA